MASFLSETDIRQAIEQVRHPAIDQTLMDPGIIKDMGIEGEKVTVTSAFSLPGIPINDRLAESARLPLKTRCVNGRYTA